VNGPSSLLQSHALLLTVKPAAPLVTKLVGIDPPPPNILLRAKVPNKIPRLSGNLTVDRVPDWDLCPDRRIDLHHGARDKILDLLAGQQVRLCMRCGHRATQAAGRNELQEHCFPQDMQPIQSPAAPRMIISLGH